MPKLKYTDRARRPSYDADPFDAVLRPPEGETPFERDERLEREHQAQKKSDKIDEMLKQEKKERRLKQEVKVLLLGQSESGKSTTLKRERFSSPPLSSLSLWDSRRTIGGC